MSPDPAELLRQIRLDVEERAAASHVAVPPIVHGTAQVSAGGLGYQTPLGPASSAWSPSSPDATGLKIFQDQPQLKLLGLIPGEPTTILTVHKGSADNLPSPSWDPLGVHVDQLIRELLPDAIAKHLRLLVTADLAGRVNVEADWPMLTQFGHWYRNNVVVNRSTWWNDSDVALKELTTATIKLIEGGFEWCQKNGCPWPASWPTP